RAVDLLTREALRLELGGVPEELILDLVLACEQQQSPSLEALLAAHRARRGATALLLAPWLDGLHGGDAELGRRVFERADLSCVRCHTAGEEVPGGGVGPDL